MPGVSTCRTCGVEVWWHRNERGGTAPPMERTNQQVNVVINGIVIKAYAWEKHVCDPAEIQRKAQAQLAQEERATHEETSRVSWHERRELAPARKAAVESVLAVLYQLAMEYECGKCHAVVGQPCENLTMRRQGNVVYTANPHAPRLAAIPENRRPYWTGYTTYEVPKESDGDTAK